MAASLASLGFGPGFEVCLPSIAAQIQETLTAVRGARRVKEAQCPEALHCVGAMARALGALWKPYVQQLLDAMMLTGLSGTLVASLTAVSDALPELLPDVQVHLLDALSLVLARRPFSPATPQARFQALSLALASGEAQGNALVRLSLQTISRFDFGAVGLLDFMRDHILPYVDDADKDIRQLAVLACCRVLERHAAESKRREATPGSWFNVRHREVVEKARRCGRGGGRGRVLTCTWHPQYADAAPQPLLSASSLAVPPQRWTAAQRSPTALHVLLLLRPHALRSSKSCWWQQWRIRASVCAAPCCAPFSPPPRLTSTWRRLSACARSLWP